MDRKNRMENNHFRKLNGGVNADVKYSDDKCDTEIDIARFGGFPPTKPIVVKYKSSFYDQLELNSGCEKFRLSYDVEKYVRAKLRNWYLRYWSALGDVPSWHRWVDHRATREFILFRTEVPPQFLQLRPRHY